MHSKPVRQKRSRSPRRPGDRCASLPGTRCGRRTGSPLRSGRRPLARIRVTKRAVVVVWGGLGVVFRRRFELVPTQRNSRELDAGSRRPATWCLPRRAARGCSESVLGARGQESDPSLPARTWLSALSVSTFYTVTAVTSRPRADQFEIDISRWAETFFVIRGVSRRVALQWRLRARIE